MVQGSLGPPPSYGAVKKKSEPLNQLPYQRKQSFRRLAYQTPLDKLHELFARHGGSQSIRVLLGRVVGGDGLRNVVLPVSNEVILDQLSHSFEPALPSSAYERLEACMDAQLAAAKAGKLRWAKVSREEVAGKVPDLPAESMTFFCPNGTWHYQLQVGSNRGNSGNSNLPPRHEVVYRFQREASGGLFWDLALCTEEDGGRLLAELRINAQLLWDQHHRLRAGKSHSFSLLLRDFLRNARCLAASLQEGKLDEVPVYYPGLFEPGAAVQSHYSQKALQGSSDIPSQSDNVRKYNNLVKTLLVEKFVDPLNGALRVLDVGCGRGQDLQKYSKAHRKAQIASYVGLDFALEAVQEARRRYAKMASGRQEEFVAAFYVGDLRSDATFEQLVAGGHTLFDVVSIQFTLQYLADSAESVHALFSRLAGFLRPGGRIIGSIPSSDALLELYSKGGAEPVGQPRRRGNGLYNVQFQGDAWSHVGQSEGELEEAFGRRWGMPYAFSLVDAVDALEEYVVPWDAFEELVASLGFKVVADAPFEDVLREYSPTSPFYSNFFLKNDSIEQMSTEEEELFRFYNCFVLEREQ